LLLACDGAKQTSTTSTPHDKVVPVKDLSVKVEQFRQEHDLPGLAVVIVDQEKIQTLASGKIV